MIPIRWLSIERWFEDQVMMVGYDGTVNVFVVIAEVGLLEGVGIAEVLFG